jgi:hypothetical protein
MRTTPCLLVFVLLVPGAAMAQRLAAYAAGGPGFTEVQPPTDILPGPVPPIGIYPSVPVLPPIPPFGGDSTFNNVTGLHWVTNGALLATQPTPAFPAAGPVFAPVPFPAAVLGAIGGGPVTGIAIDPAAGILWVVGAPGIVVGVGAVPALPIVVPPFPIPALLPPPITGLEFDGVTGSLYAVDAPGITLNFLPGGAPLGPPLPPPLALPLPAGDVAIDKTTRLNLFALRPLYVIAGGIGVDVRELVPLPFPVPLPMAVGLAFLDHPAANPPIGNCPCPGFPGPANATTGPMAAGNAAFALQITGIAPFTFGVFAFDVVWNPAFPVVNVLGCGLGLVPGSPSLFLALGLANAAGTATFPLPLPAAIGAGPLYNQNVMFCAADPTGFVFTPTQRIQVAGF